jgi:putative ABC transport system permease protein
MRIILASLRHHSLMPTLVLLQVALACAILCNVFFLAWQRLEPMLAPSGVDAHNLVLVDNLAGRRPFTTAEALAGEEVLREVPGVKAVTSAFGLPMVSMESITLNVQGPTHAAVGVSGYMGKGLVQVLGLQMVAGRDFLPSEYRAWGIGANNGPNSGWDTGTQQPIIITQALANKLFGSAPAVGGLLNDPSDKEEGHGYQVVGVVKHLLRNELSVATDGRADNTVLLARNIGNTAMLSYAVRVDPEMRESALQGIKKAMSHQFAALTAGGPQPRTQSYDEKRDAAFKDSRATLWLLLGMVLAIVIVTLVGIMGLTGFWVQRRTRQIGIRRALGARRVDILRYFLAENVVIVGAGIVVGMAFAYAGNVLLMHYYELPHLPWTYLPIGAVVMLAMGQAGVLGPALRAAAVPPVVATRAV